MRKTNPFTRPFQARPTSPASGSLANFASPSLEAFTRPFRSALTTPSCMRIPNSSRSSTAMGERGRAGIGDPGGQPNALVADLTADDLAPAVPDVDRREDIVLARRGHRQVVDRELDVGGPLRLVDERALVGDDQAVLDRGPGPLVAVRPTDTPFGLGDVGTPVVEEGVVLRGEVVDETEATVVGELARRGLEVRDELLGVVGRSAIGRAGDRVPLFGGGLGRLLRPLLGGAPILREGRSGSGRRTLCLARSPVGRQPRSAPSGDRTPVSREVVSRESLVRVSRGCERRVSEWSSC